MKLTFIVSIRPIAKNFFSCESYLPVRNLWPTNQINKNNTWHGLQEHLWQANVAKVQGAYCYQSCDPICTYNYWYVCMPWLPLCWHARLLLCCISTQYCSTWHQILGLYSVQTCSTQHLFQVMSIHEILSALFLQCFYISLNVLRLIYKKMLYLL